MIIQVQNRMNIFMSYIQSWSRDSWCLGSPHCPQWRSHSNATHAKSVPQQHGKLLFPRSPILAFASKFKEAKGLPIWIPFLPNGASRATLVEKNPPEMQEIVGGAGSIPGWGRSAGGGNSNPLQYPCLEIPMDRGAWQAIYRAESQSQA